MSRRIRPCATCLWQGPTLGATVAREPAVRLVVKSALYIALCAYAALTSELSGPTPGATLGMRPMPNVIDRVGRKWWKYGRSGPEITARQPKKYL